MECLYHPQNVSTDPGFIENVSHLPPQPSSTTNDKEMSIEKIFSMEEYLSLPLSLEHCLKLMRNPVEFKCIYSIGNIASELDVLFHRFEHQLIQLQIFQQSSLSSYSSSSSSCYMNPIELVINQSMDTTKRNIIHLLDQIQQRLNDLEPLMVHLEQIEQMTHNLIDELKAYSKDGEMNMLMQQKQKLNQMERYLLQRLRKVLHCNQQINPFASSLSFSEDSKDEKQSLASSNSFNSLSESSSISPFPLQHQIPSSFPAPIESKSPPHEDDAVPIQIQEKNDEDNKKMGELDES